MLVCHALSSLSRRHNFLNILSASTAFGSWPQNINWFLTPWSIRKRHGVWKLQKKSHSTFTFLVNKSWLKMVNFGAFLKTWSLLSNSVSRQVTLNRTKIVEKCQSWKIQNARFWVIFKHCAAFYYDCDIFKHCNTKSFIKC